MKLKFILLLAAMFAGACNEAYAQIDKAHAVKYHLAQKLLTGHYSDVQKELILEAINHPDKSLEGRAQAIFNKAQLIDVFYKIEDDMKDFVGVYNLADKSAKSDLIKTWTPERKTNLWKANFAFAIATKDLNPQQQEYLMQLSSALPQMMVGKTFGSATIEDSLYVPREVALAWEQKGVELFPRDLGRGIFATIGNAVCPTATASKKPVQGDCVCTTNSGNWSCSDSCASGGGCTKTDGGCGFLWLWDCNGSCSQSYEWIQ